MNIVHVLPSLARGGGERLAIELANRQVDAGHCVTFIIGSDLPPDRVHQGLDPRVTTHRLSVAAGRGRYAAMLPWIWRNRQWLRTQDVLHSHLTYGALFATVVKRLSGRGRPAIVETYHAVGMPIRRSSRWFHARLASQWNGLSFMVADPYWVKFVERHAGIVSRTIPVGVDAPKTGDISAAERSVYRSEHGIPKDALVVTSIGRLVPERRPRSYLPVFAEMAKALDRDVHFLLGGDGPEREAMEADADALGIPERLHFAGLVRQIARPLAVSDLYVTANVGPVPGVAGLQAIAAGVPTIALQLRDDYADGLGDWIWSSREPTEIARRGVEILRDPVVAQRVIQSQSDHLQTNHSAAAMAEAYEAFYREAMAASARASTD